MSAPKRREAIVQGCDGLLLSQAIQRLGRDRLDQGKGVLQPMAQFVMEHCISARERTLEVVSITVSRKPAMVPSLNRSGL
jgi:hypothetical protein